MRELIGEAISEAGARSIEDLGPVMKLVMAKASGAADGKRVHQLVREMLTPPPQDGS